MFQPTKVVSLASSVVLLAGMLFSAERFDLTVRNDFFAGFSGNSEALDRGMKRCESILRDNPDHPEAKVWHGSGLLFLAGVHFRKGDQQNGMQLFNRGIKQMDEAVASAPENLGVRIPRGAGYLAASPFMPPAVARPLIERGVEDYEKTYQIQQAYFDKLSDHSQGELLIGLADGHYRLGNHDRAKELFQKLAAMGARSGHLAEAKEYLSTGKLSKPVQCVGCHIK